jgi:DNA polymerase III epsilon subunit-like protein
MRKDRRSRHPETRRSAKADQTPLPDLAALREQFAIDRRHAENTHQCADDLLRLAQGLKSLAAGHNSSEREPCES